MALFDIRSIAMHALRALRNDTLCLDGDDIIDKISLYIALAALMAGKSNGRAVNFVLIVSYLSPNLNLTRAGKVKSRIPMQSTSFEGQ